VVWASANFGTGEGVAGGHSRFGVGVEVPWRRAGVTEASLQGARFAKHHLLELWGYIGP